MKKVSMKSGVPVFDSYVKQQFLDNFLRGGYPMMLGDESAGLKPFHTFSRIHGDLERDYNYFQIDACYFSVGPGKTMLPADAYIWIDGSVPLSLSPPPTPPPPPPLNRSNSNTNFNVFDSSINSPQFF
jgi:hypothetical protein